MKQRENTRLVIRLNPGERDWLKHAAKLRHIGVSEYVKRAVNCQLRKEGVDALLLRTREEFEVAGGRVPTTK